MTMNICAVATQMRLLVPATLLLALSACAGNGQFGSTPAQPIASDSGVGVPGYVQNLPKSRTGNMSEYTVFGKRYSVMDSAANFTEQGVASWYGKKFHGRKTSSGEVYDMYALTAAHKHLPLPTFVRVTNLDNNHSVVVKVNDRGPFVGDRIIDMSYTAAQMLGMVENGVANVRVDALSTHLVDENPDTSNVSVAQSFSRNARDSATAAPEVVEAEVAAVPLQQPLLANKSTDTFAEQQVEQLATPVESANALARLKPVDDLGSASTNELSQDNLAAAPANVLENAPILVDGSEDGFVESPALGAASLDDTSLPVLKEPAEVAALMSEQPSSGLRSTTATDGNVYIQLGAFSQQTNAYAMVDDVDEKTGLPAFVERDSGQRLFRVKMGPFQEGGVLENTLDALASIGIESYTKLATKY